MYCVYMYCVYYYYYCIVINCIEFFRINIVFELWFTFLLRMWGEMVMGGGNGYGGEMTKGKNFMGGIGKNGMGGGNGYGGEMTRHRVGYFTYQTKFLNNYNILLMKCLFSQGKHWKTETRFIVYNTNPIHMIQEKSQRELTHKILTAMFNFRTRKSTNIPQNTRSFLF